MKLVRTAALSRLEAPQFAALTDEEVVALRLVPAWVRWLYLELVAMSDFKTGLIYTSYARLASLLDCDQPERGQRLDVPTLKQIRTALDTLNRMNLALRDRAGNEEKRELKIFVRPRDGLGASTDKQGREKGRPQSRQNYDKHGAQRKPDRESGQRSGQGVQEPNTLLPPPLHVDNLSTRGDRSNTSKKAPPGGPSPAPAGHAPVVPAMQPLAAALEGVGQHQGPPGGQSSAPAGHAPPDGRFVGPPPPMQARGVDMRDPANWPRDEQGRLVPPVGHAIHRLNRAQSPGLDGAGPDFSFADRFREPSPRTASSRGGGRSGDG